MKQRTAPPQALIAAVDSGVVDFALLQQIAREACTSQESLLDDIADYVARSYDARTMSYDAADRAMNAAYSLSVQEKYLAANDRTLPSLVIEVYEAFYSGEYHHHGDTKDIDPEVKYTKPLIKAYLSSARDDA
jgi:hypothetical protein